MDLGAPRRSSWLRRWAGEIAVLAGYLLASLAVVHPLLANPHRLSPAYGGGDHMYFQWALAHAARVMSTGEYPFVTDRLNAPDGVNLMANTSVLGLGIPFAPVTLLWGAAVSYVVILLLGLAGTAYGWYWVFSRRLGMTRMGAVLGGAFCGFAPGVISHVQGHLNWTTLLLVPFIVDRVLRLSESERTVRDGLILAALVVYQAFINQEVLLFIALGVGVFGVVYVLSRRREARPLTEVRRFFAGLALPAAAAAAALAYPLWVQFLGPNAYHGIGLAKRNGNDVVSFVEFSRYSLAGDAASTIPLVLNGSEENSFLGWPLVVVCAALAGWLWRDVVVRSAAVTAAVFAVLSLGTRISIDGRLVGVYGPWVVTRRMPLLDSVIPTRLALIMVPCVGLILGVGISRLAAGRLPTVAPTWTRWAGIGAVAAALVPILPMPVPTRDFGDVPRLITEGTWREYVPDGTSVWVVANSRPLDTTGMRWSTATGLDLRLVGGYFLARDPRDGRARFGAVPRPTSAIIARLGRPGTVTDAERLQAREDVRFWRAAAVFRPVMSGADPMMEALSDLFGPPDRQRGGVWIWDLRDWLAG